MRELNKSAAICLGVGGTNIDGAVVSQSYEILKSVESIPSVSPDEYQEGLDKLEGLLSILKQRAHEAGYAEIAGGIGMPGPFDYETGVSEMEHKFQMFKGEPLKQDLQTRLKMPVYFLNDADAFGLGAYSKEHPDTQRLIGITVGTGLGSSYISGGQVMNSGPGIPDNGEVWNFPYEDGILEDTVSGRGLASLYMKLTRQDKTPLEIENLAREGDDKAKLVYRKLGEVAGKGLASISAEFRPQVVVAGGKIARAFDLWGKVAEDTFNETGDRPAKFVPAKSEDLALYGVAAHVFRATN